MKRFMKSNEIDETFHENDEIFYKVMKRFMKIMNVMKRFMKFQHSGRLSAKINKIIN